MNRNKTGELQVTLFCEILLEHFQSLFRRSNRDAFLENEIKIY